MHESTRKTAPKMRIAVADDLRAAGRRSSDISEALDAVGEVVAIALAALLQQESPALAAMRLQKMWPRAVAEAMKGMK